MDFGATRTYSKSFVDSWYRFAQAIMKGDRDEMVERSIKLNYLTGEENNVCPCSPGLRMCLSLIGHA